MPRPPLLRASDPFLGASLLEYGAGSTSGADTIDERVLQAWAAGDWRALEELDTRDAAAMAVAADRTCDTDVDPHAVDTAAAAVRATADAPHLRPDIIFLPLASASTPYMRREIVVWGDCVKLRYGLRATDSPWLWATMARYVRRMARIFPALRLDNAHGTPLHVAAAMLDAARAVRPDIYVNAELFTGSLARDVEYVSRLGINSFVRESMQANDAADLARSVYSYGGSPIASMRPPVRGGSAAAKIEALVEPDVAALLVHALGREVDSMAASCGSDGASADNLHTLLQIADGDVAVDVPSATLALSSTARSHVPHSNDFINGFRISAIGLTRRLPRVCSNEATRSAAIAGHRLLLTMSEATVSEVLPAALPALLFDATHDNPAPAEKRHASDALPNAAIVAAAVCAGGSVRGYDILVPEALSVVTEHRIYGAGSVADVDTHGLALPEQPRSSCSGVRFAVDMRRGMRLPRLRLNALKQEMAASGHTEVHVTSASVPGGADIVTIVRGHPSLPSSFVIIARTAFSRNAVESSRGSPLPVLRFEGRATSVLLASRLTVPLRDVRVRAPVGERLRYPSVFAPDHRANSADALALGIALLTRGRGALPQAPTRCGPAVEDVLTVAGVALARDNARTAAGYYPHNEGGRGDTHSSDDGGNGACWDADQDVINGLPCAIEYSDDAMEALGTASAGVNAVHVSSSAELLTLATRGLATFSESVPNDDGGGAVATNVTLNADAFTAGSVLIFRMRTPRNVAIRAAPITVDSVMHQHTAQRSLVDSSSASPMFGSVDAETTTFASPIPMPTSALAAQSSVSLSLHGRLAATALPFTLSSCTLDATQLSETTSTRGEPVAPRLAPPPVQTLRRIPTASRRSVLYGPPLSELEVALAPTSRGGGVTLVSLNALLFRSEAEEREDSSGGRGVYVVPGAGPLPWAGLAGVAHALRVARKWNDMGAPLLENIRQGHWLMDYTLQRLAIGPPSRPELANVAAWLQKHFDIIRAMPPGLRPQGFDRVVTAAYHAAVAAVLARLGGPLFAATNTPYQAAQHYLVEAPHGTTRDSSVLVMAHSDPAAPQPLLTALALISVQLWGVSRTAPLLALPLLVVDDVYYDATGTESPAHLHLEAAPASLAAGVDHFSIGYMRCWGRDTYMSMRGLFIATGRYADARVVLLAGGALIRHGLLPNLMDGGAAPRYNCRDAVWWWLQALQDYTTEAPEGAAILRARVIRRFPSDDAADYGVDGVFTGVTPQPTTIADLVYEVLTKHVAGIDFTEWGAGRAIDAHMQKEGFHVTAGVDASTGLVSGGNAYNCGTWMDKMGESIASGTDGVPATPRDGAAIEIVALAYSAVAWLAELAARSPPACPFAGVGINIGSNISTQEHLSFRTWAGRLMSSFERAFYVPVDACDDVMHAVNSSFASVRGIYRDTSGATGGWPDYQLRPNVLVAMVVAPALFTPARANRALDAIECALLGDASQLGVKTLDPRDWAFRGNYDNSAEGERGTARGWNYHNGPEWLWPYGFYIRARMRFPPPQIAMERSSRRAADNNIGGSRDSSPPDVSAVNKSYPREPVWPSYVELKRWVFARLQRHRQHLETSSDGGLPELTNRGGAPCRDSCYSQAWSAATLLDALLDLHHAAVAAASPAGANNVKPIRFMITK